MVRNRETHFLGRSVQAKGGIAVDEVYERREDPRRPIEGSHLKIEPGLRIRAGEQDGPERHE